MEGKPSGIQGNLLEYKEEKPGVMNGDKVGDIIAALRQSQLLYEKGCAPVGARPVFWV